MGFLSAIAFLVLLIVLAPFYWLLSRYAKDGTPKRACELSDESMRRTFRIQSDYDVLRAAQIDADKKAYSDRFRDRYRELATEEALRRGLEPDKPISPNTRGFPVHVEKPIWVKGHFRRRGFRH